MRESVLQRIIRKTGRKPIECRCKTCQAQCMVPCLGTPDDILRLIQAGYGDRLALTHWCVGLLLGKMNYTVPMVQAIQTDEGCTFFHDGLCELHDKGLKPTEGRLSYHTITKENLKFSRTLSWNIVQEWLSFDNLEKVENLLLIYMNK